MYGHARGERAPDQVAGLTLREVRRQGQADGFGEGVEESGMNRPVFGIRRHAAEFVDELLIKIEEVKCDGVLRVAIPVFADLAGDHPDQLPFRRAFGQLPNGIAHFGAKDRKLPFRTKRAEKSEGGHLVAAGSGMDVHECSPCPFLGG